MDTASYLVYIRNMHIAQPNYSEYVLKLNISTDRRLWLI